jgi:acetylornithine/N-succinyldiaminopimelate aminotransferase
MTDKTVAVMVEPIQGEGGINTADKAYIEGLRKLCDEKDMLLIFDEIQTGMGRTGEMFCYKHYGVQPDVMTLAKSLGGGVPIGATIAATRVANVLSPSSHASTFGGSPIVCAAAIATFEAIEKEKLLDNTIKMGKYLVSRLEGLKKDFDFIKGIKGRGLMLGVELSIDAMNIFEECFKRKLLINCTQGNILRIMPPLVVKKAEIDKAAGILREAMEAEKGS